MIQILEFGVMAGGFIHHLKRVSFFKLHTISYEM